MAESPFARFGLPAGPSRGNPGRAGLLQYLHDIRTGYTPTPPNASFDFGAVMLNIPELDYYIITERFPDLKSPDAEIKTRAWKKFARSEASLPYRMK